MRHYINSKKHLFATAHKFGGRITVIISGTFGTEYVHTQDWAQVLHLLNVKYGYGWR